MKLQSFESTFFTWIKNYKDIVESYKSTYGTSVDGLNSAFELTFKDLNKDADTFFLNSTNDQHSASRLENNILEEWHWFINGSEVYVYRIVNNFLLLVRWIDKAKNLRKDEKSLYFRIVAAQLTAGELKLIYLFARSGQGEELASLCAKHNLLENFDMSSGIWRFLEERVKSL